MIRLTHVTQAVQPQPSTFGDFTKQEDDVVICCALRTPLCPAKKGALAKVPIEELLMPLVRETLQRTGVNPGSIGDVQIGNVLGNGCHVIAARQGVIAGGLPASVPCQVTSRQCSSGLQCVASVAADIRAGVYEIGLAGGFESMSTSAMDGLVNPNRVSPKVMENVESKNCLIPMGLTSENVTSTFRVSRADQDQFAALSHQKAAKAQQAGKFEREIVPVPVGAKMVTQDGGIRGSTTAEGLAALSPAFKVDGCTTAGNSSQTTDGAGLVLLARRSAAKAQGLPILAKFRGFAVKGCPPEIMGIGPAVAIPAVLHKVGLTKEQVGVYEINEAFASQALYCIHKLGLDPARVNPNGGAIALGHPLGATGARMIATLLPELGRTGHKYGVVSMCVGGGMGAAAVIESEL